MNDSLSALVSLIQSGEAHFTDSGFLYCATAYGCASCILSRNDCSDFRNDPSTLAFISDTHPELLL